MHKSYTPLAKCICKYFIPFDAIINGTIFLISFCIVRSKYVEMQVVFFKLHLKLWQPSCYPLETEVSAKRWQRRDMETTRAPDDTTELMSQLCLQSLQVDFVSSLLKPVCFFKKKKTKQNT